MKLKNKIVTLSTLLILQTFGTVNAAAIEEELAVIAAEQNNNDEQVETFDPDSLDSNKNKNKSRAEIRAEEKRLKEERKAAKKKIKAERQKSRDELSGKARISKNPAPIERRPRNNSPQITPTIQPEQKSEPAQENPPVAEIPSVGMPSPLVTYSNFEEIVKAVNFTPLYIPKKSGYTITLMTTIDNRIAEIRYGRKWEQNVSLHVRTLKRMPDEELKDISGVHGVKWRVNVSNGVTTYIAKIDENKHVAAWAIGNYTFSAYAENLSFAAFHALISDELVDLSDHYYAGY